MNFAKPISNAISYARREPVGAATVLIALDLAKKVAASSAGATVASVIGSYAMNRAMMLNQIRLDLTKLAASILGSATKATMNTAAASAKVIRDLAKFVGLLNGSMTVTKVTKDAAMAVVA